MASGAPHAPRQSLGLNEGGLRDRLGFVVGDELVEGGGGGGGEHGVAEVGVGQEPGDGGEGLDVGPGLVFG